MPTVLTVGGYRFFFYSNERAEPPHVHVQQAERLAKFWLAGVALASNKGFRQSEISELHRIISAHQQLLLEKWNDYFGSK